MFKCTECGLEFETKPEYCDCGNDEFVLTISEEKEIIEEAPKPEIINNPEPHDNYNYIYAKNDTIKPSLSPFSIIISIFCLILSFIIIFIWNPKSEQKTVPQINIEEKQVQIPSIDKLWKDAVVKATPDTSTELPTQKQIALPLIKKEPTKIVPAKKTISGSVLPKTKTTNPINTFIKKQTTQQQTQQQTQPTKPQTKTQTPIIDTKKAAEEDAKKLAELQKAEEAKRKAEAEAIAATNAAKNAALLKQEYSNYKISLRNAIAKKIDFTKVIGDGNCTISFKLDSSGKLINKSFTKQSSNLTLNNAVYKAIMSTPSFTQPPSGYKNENLMLNITFNNGNFTITLD